MAPRGAASLHPQLYALLVLVCVAPPQVLGRRASPRPPAPVWVDECSEVCPTCADTDGTGDICSKQPYQRCFDEFPYTAGNWVCLCVSPAAGRSVRAGPALCDAPPPPPTSIPPTVTPSTSIPDTDAPPTLVPPTPIPETFQPLVTAVPAPVTGQPTPTVNPVPAPTPEPVVVPTASPGAVAATPLPTASPTGGGEGSGSGDAGAGGGEEKEAEEEGDTNGGLMPLFIVLFVVGQGGLAIAVWWICKQKKRGDDDTEAGCKRISDEADRSRAESTGSERPAGGAVQLREIVASSMDEWSLEDHASPIGGGVGGASLCAPPTQCASPPLGVAGGGVEWSQSSPTGSHRHAPGGVARMPSVGTTNPSLNDMTSSQRSLRPLQRPPALGRAREAGGNFVTDGGASLGLYSPRGFRTNSPRSDGSTRDFQVFVGSSFAPGGGAGAGGTFGSRRISSLSPRTATAGRGRKPPVPKRFDDSAELLRPSSRRSRDAHGSGSASGDADGLPPLSYDATRY